MNSPRVKIDRLHPGQPTWRQRLSAYALLVRLNRPIGILLLLWPTLWALWIAGAGNPPWEVVLIFSLGVVLMRSAGCAINDFADRHIDGRVQRTRERPLATGLVRPREAVAVFLLRLMGQGMMGHAAMVAMARWFAASRGRGHEGGHPNFLGDHAPAVLAQLARNGGGWIGQVRRGAHAHGHHHRRPGVDRQRDIPDRMAFPQPSPAT